MFINAQHCSAVYHCRATWRSVYALSDCQAKKQVMNHTDVGGSTHL
jgi:hypothetical protein